MVENKPGAGTVIGVDAVAKAAADGYSLVTRANSFCVNHTLVKSSPYDSQKDLRPVALMGLSEHVLPPTPAAAWKTAADIVALARSKPGSLSYASFGQGTSAHLAGGNAEDPAGRGHRAHPLQRPGHRRWPDLLGGQVSMMFGNWPEFRSHAQSGKLVALGMATAKRSVYAPQVPTLAEQVLATNSRNGLLVPRARQTPSSSA